MPDARHVVVVTGGEAPGPDTARWLPGDAVVIAADSGLAHARSLGLHVDVAVGDFDSVDPAVLDEAARTGTHVERHPVAKDRTDLDLALAVAIRLGAEHLTVVGGHGGRLDHALANVLALAQAAYAGVAVDAVMGHARLAVVRDRVELVGEVGEVVSLLPVGGPARGVTTEGLWYPLDGEDLEAGTTRGVSNEMAAPVAAVSVRSGVLVAVLPGERGTHALGRRGGADGPPGRLA